MPARMYWQLTVDGLTVAGWKISTYHPTLIALTKTVSFFLGSPQKICSPLQAFNMWSTLNTELVLGYLSMLLLKDTVPAYLCASLATKNPCRLMASFSNR